MIDGSLSDVIPKGEEAAKPFTPIVPFDGGVVLISKDGDVMTFHFQANSGVEMRYRLPAGETKVAVNAV